MNEMLLAFTTERLRVFAARVTPWLGSAQRVVYLAFFQTPGAAQTVGHAIVSDQRGVSPPVPLPLYCELLEVSAMFRRQRYGTELFQGIEKHIEGKLEGHAATTEGKAFLISLGRETDQLAQALVSFRPYLDALLADAQQKENAPAVEVLTGCQQIATDPNRSPTERIDDLRQLMTKVTEILGGTTHPAGGDEVPS